uniref:IVa2 n=1 Tax=Zoothera dauma adenovirus TaxID=3073259 RepID=A0AA51NQ73_9ADEN|nr:IVa2 [Zoothera dauma adenovirus]
MHKIDETICKDPFPTIDTITRNMTYNAQLMNEIGQHASECQKITNETNSLLVQGCIPTLNNGLQPFIITVYGPTGSGKSQFIRNIVSNKLLYPAPETVFFVTPQKGTIPTEELMAWKAQCVEGAYDGQNNPITNKLVPEFVPLSFDEAINEDNLNLDSPQNIFMKAAKNGPICIIMDECMNKLGTCRSISSFFHALPSKIFNRFPKCSGYTVIIVLHNMCPRYDKGNIKDLKIQSKCHIISPQLDGGQISRFINTYSFGFDRALISIIKDIIDHARLNSKYSWLIYNNVPACESFRWSYYTPDENIKPLYMNIQSLYLRSCKAIKRVHRQTNYHRMRYINKLNSFY